MRRVLATTAVVVLVLGITATRAMAHTELTPATADAGSVVSFELFVEDEQSDAATTKVELVFPEPITVVELPDAPGFTAAVIDGTIGGPATGVTWEGAGADGDVRVRFTLGPLPETPGRLQFKVLQTYDNGEVDRWIEDWPAGAPEPDSPGPVVDLVAGEAVSTTAGETETVPETTAAPDTTASDEVLETTAAPAEDDSDDDSNLTVFLVIFVAALALGAGGAALVLRRRHQQPQP